MLPLFPYSGILRPLIMLVAISITFAVLHKSRRNPRHGQLLWLACVGYGFFLVYATFLSREVAKTYAYRLQLMGSARSAISVDGGFWPMIHGDFSGIHLNNPQSLEAIVINIMLMVPVGYLLPQVFRLRGRKLSDWQVILCGSLCSAAIEVVQLCTRLGMLDVDDWLFNTIGTALGYLLYCMVERSG